jgi:hypothetical protein
MKTIKKWIKQLNVRPKTETTAGKQRKHLKNMTVIALQFH